MASYLVAYLITAIVFFVIDIAWIGWLGKGVYSQLGPLLLERPRMGAAAAFYAAYVVGIVYFAVAPALAEGNLGKAVLNGAIFGLLAYATYDMTNYATLKGYPLQVALIDMAWGTVLTASAAAAGYLGTRLFFSA